CPLSAPSIRGETRRGDTDALYPSARDRLQLSQGRVGQSGGLRGNRCVQHDPELSIPELRSPHPTQNGGGRRHEARLSRKEAWWAFDRTIWRRSPQRPLASGGNRHAPW